MLELGLFWCGAAIIVVALLMLFIDAFKQNAAWGIAGLVLLVPLLVHIFLAWSSLAVRKATYALIIGVLAILVSIAGGALAHLPFLTEHEVVQSLEENIAPPKDSPLPNEEQAQAITDSATEGDDYDPLLSGSEFEEVDVEEMVPPSAPPVQRTAAPRYLPIPAEDLAAVINKQVRISMANGETVNGTLTHIEESAVTVESAVEGGSLGLSYSMKDIKSIAVRLAPGESLPTLDPQQIDDAPGSDATDTEQAVGAETPEQIPQDTQAPQLQATDASLPDEVVAPGDADDVQEIQETIKDATESTINEITPEADPDTIIEP